MKFSIKENKFDFVKHKNKFFLGSFTLFVIGIICLFTFGLNLGIDFSSGSRVDIHTGQKVITEEIRSEFETIGLKPDDITYAGERDIAVAEFIGVLSQNEIAKINTQFSKKYATEPTISTVSPQIGSELAKTSLIAVIISLIGIIIYMTIRFDLLQGLAAVVALFHDAFFMIAVFSIFQIEINITFIAAILTIVGYSINDTIVTFDRIRENMKLNNRVKSLKDVSKIVNLSLAQTLSRSIYTVLTVVFASAALLIFGGEAIRTFSLAILIGLITGTYSSIFISSQLWAVWKGKQLKGRLINY